MSIRNILRGRRSVPSPPGFSGLQERPPITRERVDRGEITYHCRSRQSPDGLWRITYGRATERDDSRLFIFHDGELIEEQDVTRPKDAGIANDGTGLILEGGAFDQLDGRAVIVDSTGREQFSQRFTVNLKDGMIAPDGQWAAILTQPPAAALYLIDIMDKAVTRFEDENSDAFRLLGFVTDSGDRLLYIARGERDEPYLAVGTDGEIAWRSERYRDTESIVHRMRNWVQSRHDSPK